MVEIRTLGELSVSDGGRRIRLPTKKHYALLVYLVAYPDRPFLRDRLAALLWGGSPDSRARHSLNQTLYGIRKYIPGLRLQVTAHEVLMPAGGETYADFVAFRRAVDERAYREAVRLYVGDFLEGFAISKSPEFEDWLENQRESLRRQAVVSLGCIMDEEERAGHWAEVEELATRIIRIDPYRETVHKARIRAIAASGDPRRAREELQRTSELLGYEIEGALDDINLSVERALEQALLVTDLDDDSVDHSPTKFVGRVEPYQRLCTEWRHVRSGTGRVVLVTGEAGIGKTRFCNHFLRLAAIQGARCFLGRCYSTERSIPFSGIVDALASGLRTKDVDSLSPRWISVLSEIIPQISAPSQSEAWSFDREEYRLRILEAMVQVTTNIARSSPVVIFIDDFQWADHSTITVVHYMARRLSGHPVMTLLSIRNDDADYSTPLARFRAEMAQHPQCVEIALSELDREEVRLLVDSYCRRNGVTVTQEHEEAIFHRVGGRPFFIIELLRASAVSHSPGLTLGEFNNPASHDPLPESIHRFLRTRFDLLSPEEAQVLGALAVLGKGATLHTLRSVTRLEDLTTSDVVTSLIRKGLVRETGGEIGFAHDLLREGAYEWLGSYKRRVLHEYAAEALQAEHRPSPGILAVHYDLAENKAQAFDYALMAAEASEKVNSLVEAEHYLSRALDNAYDERTQAIAYERMAHFLFRSRRYDEAEKYFDNLSEYYRARSDRRGLLFGDVNKIAAALQCGRISGNDAVKLLETSVYAAEELKERDLFTFALRQLIIAAHSISDRMVVLKWADVLIDPSHLDESGSSTIKNLCVASVALGIYRSAQEGLEIANRACEVAYRLDDRLGQVAALRARAANYMCLGLLSLAMKDVEEATDMADRLGNSHRLFDALIIGIMVERARGNWDKADEFCNRIDAIVNNGNAGYYGTIAKSNRMTLEYDRGHNDEATYIAGHVIEMNRTLSNPWIDLTAWSILGLCALDRGAIDEARRCRAEVLRHYEGRDFWISDVSYAEIFLARLASLEGDVRGAVERLAQAIAAFEDRDVLCRSRMQLERARLLRELDPAESRKEAELVRARAEEMGARPLVEKAEAVLAY